MKIHVIVTDVIAHQEIHQRQTVCLEQYLYQKNKQTVRTVINDFSLQVIVPKENDSSMTYLALLYQ